MQVTKFWMTLAACTFLVFAQGRGATPEVSPCDGMLPSASEPIVTPTPVTTPTAISTLPDPVASNALHGPIFWTSVDALFWWVKSTPVVPLVTINQNPNTIASLSEAGTSTLVGGPGSPINFGNINGIRGTVGGWLLPDAGFGIEGTVYALPKQGRSYNFSSGGLDGPVIAVPFYSTVPLNFNSAGETTTNSGNVPSQISVNATTQLFGTEGVGLASVCRGEFGEINILGGFQYLQLKETLSLRQEFLDTVSPGTLTLSDQFATNNQFYGVLVGLRGGLHYGPFGCNVTGKIAFGPNMEQSIVAGSSLAEGQAFGLAPGSISAGTFAQPSNSGTFDRNIFIVVPQVQAKLTYDVIHNVRFSVGYDFLYMSSVLRASNQIDRTLNPTQNVDLATPTGLPAPFPGFNKSDFWAQGISAGLQIQF